jgi:hypothetical protein
MEIQGKVIAILEPQRFVSQKNGNEYVTTAFVIETPGQYPKKVAMKVMGEDKFKQMGIFMGGTYNVSFDVESREWQGKWFTECQAWRAVRMDGQQSSTNASQSPSSQPQAHNNAKTDDSNLPF